MIRAKTAKETAQLALRTWQRHGPACPCHACQSTGFAGLGALRNVLTGATKSGDADYAFEVASSNVRFGPGVTSEVGYDFKNLKAKKVAVFTDPNLVGTDAVKKALQSLDSQNVPFEVFSDVVVEPKLYAVEKAVNWARELKPDAFLAVGGGSVMDTCKVANLMLTYHNNQILDFVNAPVGKALPITEKLRPLIAIPTTAGTGSETTGTAIFDLPDIKAKVGISSRALRPLLGIVDPLNAAQMPPAIRASSGLDVLCHALESYTAIPYDQRTPRPANPILRPAYQGANPISDVFSLQALKMVVKYLPRSVRDPEDTEAVNQTLLAATLAGIGFGNAGVHLCHGLSYPLSSQNKSYIFPGYEKVGHPIVPHGVSVAVTSPAVFEFTGPSCPDRHLECAAIFGADISNAKKEDAGKILGDALRKFLLQDLSTPQPRGISELGYSSSDIPSLVAGALPQRRVMTLEKQIHTMSEPEIATELAQILEKSLKY